MNISTVIADMSYEQQLKTDVSYHYHETTLPPLKFMPNLWEFIEKALHNSCTLTIKNTNLLSGVKNNQESDTLNVICIEYIMFCMRIYQALFTSKRQIDLYSEHIHNHYTV